MNKLILREIRKQLKEMYLYHGSDYKFDRFDTKNFQVSSGKSVGGWGIYLSEDPNTSAQYASGSGGVYTVDYFGRGNWFDLDEIPDEHFGTIIKGLYEEGVSEDSIEQFKNEYAGMGNEGYDAVDGYSVYDWLSYIFENEMGASLFLSSLGFSGNKYHDKINPDVTNYVVFDPSRLKIVDFSYNK